MIELLPGFPPSVLAIRCWGQVSKGDYETVLIPELQRVLRAHRKVRLYYQLGPGWLGFDSGAIWDDFIAGTEHLDRWERTAVVTDAEWVRCMCQALSLFVPGGVRVFDFAEASQSKAWIVDGLPALIA